MIDSSKGQDGIGGPRLFCIVRTAKFGYGSFGSVVTYRPISEEESSTGIGPLIVKKIVEAS